MKVYQFSKLFSLLFYLQLPKLQVLLKKVFFCYLWNDLEMTVMLLWLLSLYLYKYDKVLFHQKSNNLNQSSHILMLFCIVLNESHTCEIICYYWLNSSCFVCIIHLTRIQLQKKLFIYIENALLYANQSMPVSKYRNKLD